MTIASLQAKPFNVRLRRPFSFFAYTLKALPYALVSITTREGIRGIGEAALAWDVTGETQPGALAVTKLLKGVVEKKHIDSVDDVKDILEEINGAVFGNTGLKTALESALLDGLGQEKQKPIFRLLKASPKKSVTFQKTFSFEELDAAIGDIAQQYASQGVSVFKFKIGKNAERELRALQKVRRACPKATLTLDGNQAWRRYQEAQRFLNKTKPMHIAWVEQPLHWDDTDGLATVRSEGDDSILREGGDRLYAGRYDSFAGRNGVQSACGDAGKFLILRSYASQSIAPERKTHRKGPGV